MNCSTWCGAISLFECVWMWSIQGILAAALGGIMLAFAIDWVISVRRKWHGVSGENP